MKAKCIISIVVFTLSAMTAIPSFSANLLTNGSFEQPGCSANCILNTPAQAGYLPGWTTFLSGVEYFNVKASVGGSSAADGSNVIDLANYDYKNGGGIQQNFNTSVGARYRLTFYAGNIRSSGRTGSGVIDVKVAGQTVSFNTPVATGQTIVWAPVSYEFTAKTPQTTLSFSNEQDPLLHFALIDNVSIETVQ
ncbi:DUF642 domain-containing protein [Pseudomonas capsici]|uniref:DUF642 domain-containing protein n=1 Tax=Pseudomonas capsici TaxID=2810614 RepID=UPI000E3E3291|nr:hypothetical protein PSCICF_28380 [Pseudomonas cichorii]